MPEKIFAYDKGKCKQIVAGEYYSEKGIFYKVVDSIHFMRKFNGYGIQYEVIEQLEKLGCKKVLIKAGDIGYISEFSKWKNEEVMKLDFGHGLQVFQSIGSMEKKEIKK
jgi:hypothetical protein